VLSINSAAHCVSGLRTAATHCCFRGKVSAAYCFLGVRVTAAHSVSRLRITEHCISEVRITLANSGPWEDTSMRCAFEVDMFSSHCVSKVQDHCCLLHSENYKFHRVSVKCATNGNLKFTGQEHSCDLG
jgi:hypothetical protein